MTKENDIKLTSLKDTYLDIVVWPPVLGSVAATPGKRRHITSRLTQIRSDVYYFPLERAHVMDLRYIQLTATLNRPGTFIVLRFYYYRHLLVAIAGLYTGAVRPLHKMNRFIAKVLLFNLVQRSVRMFPQKSGHFPIF